MKKDIFIDNNVSKNFANPADPEYKKLLSWLFLYTRNPNEDAYLVVSIKLIEEYIATSGACNASTNICVVIDRLQSQGRLVIITKKQISSFRRTHYKSHVVRNLTCTNTDRNYHIPTVLLSERRYALSIDDAFINDLLNFPGFSVVCAKRPELIPYT